MIAQKDVGLSVGYGLGATCEAEFESETLRGVSVRNLLKRVTEMPQSSPQAARTADVLQAVLRTNRLLDIEVLRDPIDDVKPGKPVKLDDVLLGGDDDATDQQPHDISLRVSEPYRGGTRS